MDEQNMIEQAMSGLVKGFFAEMAARDAEYERKLKEVENVSNARAAECKALTNMAKEAKEQAHHSQRNEYELTRRLDLAQTKVREMIKWITKTDAVIAIEMIGKRGCMYSDLQDMMVNEYCCITGITEQEYWKEPEEEYVGDDE